jgi:hypothetical protein
MDDDLTDLFANGEKETVKQTPRHMPRWDHVEHWELEWEGDDENKRLVKSKRPKKVGERGTFVMQWGEFDIYVYKNSFMLRWGALYYSKMHKYDTITSRIDGKWSLPVEAQGAILAARAMLMGIVS